MNTSYVKKTKESSLVHLLTFAKKKVWFVKDNVYGRVLWVAFASQKKKGRNRFTIT